MQASAEGLMATSFLRNVADGTTSTVIALLSLLGIALLGYGLIRAIVMNRQPQVVVSDIAGTPSDADFASAAALSSVMRSYVQSNVSDQCRQITRIGDEILSPASEELKPRVHFDAAERIQRAANDSIATLLTALRSVAPGSEDRFVGLFSVILPPAQGIAVSTTLLKRGADSASRIGASVEIIRLDGRPVASEIFWEGVLAAPKSDVAQPDSTERILGLLQPTARWIAVHLVLILMVSPNQRVDRQVREGLRHLLAGGLFLTAMRDFPGQALTFGETARAELAEAREQLQELHLPVTTLAGVHERMGWAHHQAGQSATATDNFRTAVRLWQAAEKLVREDTELAELLDRRLKAQLLSGDPDLSKRALIALTSITCPAALLTNRVWLYNRACLYALASNEEPDADYRQHALLWLGLALVADHRSSNWDYAAKHDPELAPLRPVLGQFLACLRNMVSEDHVTFEHADAKAIVTEAIRRAFSGTKDLP